MSAGTYGDRSSVYFHKTTQEVCLSFLIGVQEVDVDIVPAVQEHLRPLHAVASLQLDVVPMAI